MRNVLRSTLLAAALLGISCGRTEIPPPINPDGPRLALVLVVDQFRADYFSRFGPLFSGGLKRIHETGVRFDSAHHDHALTVTAAGHATLASGLHPSRSSIIGNSWYSRELGRTTYSFEDLEHHRSPSRLLGTTLADWIKTYDPRSRSYSFSAKDRSAIALGGHLADGAFWYDDGEFISSSYYPERKPKWLKDFNERSLVDAWFGRTWAPLEVPAEALAEAGVFDFDTGPFDQPSPYALGGQALVPDSSFYDDISGTPFVDDFTLQAATAAVTAQALGQGDALDYLAIALSAVDGVGHRFGPNSPELADTLLRLDRELGVFLDFLDRTVGEDKIAILFSSDHGVLEIPEIRQAAGLPAHRLGREDFLCTQRAGLSAEQFFGLAEIDWVESGLYFDHDALAKAKIVVADLESYLAQKLEECPAVARVWTRTELETTRTDEPEYFRRLYRHSFHEANSPDLIIQYEEYTLPSATRATHGSPYRYDTWVPMIFVIPGLPASAIDQPARTVDAALTLASQLGIPFPSDLDGEDLSSTIAENTGQHRTNPAYLSHQPGERQP